MEAIKTGTEDRRYVRIQVIGKHGVGKSSLVRRLLNETIHDIESTDGIDIIKKCEIRISDGKWFVVKGMLCLLNISNCNSKEDLKIIC